MYRPTTSPERDEGGEAFKARRPASRTAATSDVRAAIVVPAYGQPALTGEALRSALDQRTDFPYAIVVVNDGCPQEATHEVCQTFCAANPGKIFYLRKRNGGLSAARNTGIEFSLAAFPALEAVYFLDCDNRMGPHLLQRLLNALRAGDARTGWTYADVDKFGFPEFGDLSGPYSPIEHLFRNVSEAGSMAARRMLDAGIRFDTNMRKGVEDWEFWLQGLERGFRGIHVADAGFRYRRRGESMLVAAERDFGPIVDYIRQRHPDLFTPKAILEREAAERSRLAVYHPDTGRIRCFTATGDDAFLDRDEYLMRLLRSMERPGYGLCPGHLMVVDEQLFAHLKQRRFLAGILWVLECAVARAPCAAIRLSPGSAGSGTLRWTGRRLPLPSERPAFLTFPDDVHLVAVEATSLLADGMSRLDFPGIATQPGKPLHGLLLNVEIAEALPKIRATAAGGLATLGRELAAAAEREHRALWHSVALDRWRAKPALPRDVYEEIGLPSLFPCAANGAAGPAALVVETPAADTWPLVADVREKLRRQGRDVHLVALGSALDWPAEDLEGFSEVVMLPWRELRAFPDPVRKRSYLGTTVRQLEQPEMRDALATLAAYDTVVAIASDIPHTLMGSLRRFKVKTWCVLTGSKDTLSAGDMINSCAAFEPAYDAIHVQESRMLHLCRAWGIPESKLHLLEDPRAPLGKTRAEPS